MKLSAKINGMKSLAEITKAIDDLEADRDDANLRCQRLVSENNRMREILGCDPETHTDRQRPITIGDLQDLEARILRRLGRPDSKISIVMEEYPEPKDDEIIEGGRGLGRLVGAER